MITRATEGAQHSGEEQLTKELTGCCAGQGLVGEMSTRQKMQRPNQETWVQLGNECSWSVGQWGRSQVVWDLWYVILRNGIFLFSPMILAPRWLRLNQPGTRREPVVKPSQKKQEGSDRARKSHCRSQGKSFKWKFSSAAWPPQDKEEWESRKGFNLITRNNLRTYKIFEGFPKGKWRGFESLDWNKWK